MIRPKVLEIIFIITFSIDMKKLIQKKFFNSKYSTIVFKNYKKESSPFVDIFIDIIPFFYKY